MNKELMNIGKDISNYLNSIGYNIGAIQAYKKGERLFLKRFKNDQIIFNQYFDQSWESGTQLVFTISNNKLKFIKYGAFKWRNEKYNTEINNNLLKNLIKEIENYKLN